MKDLRTYPRFGQLPVELAEWLTPAPVHVHEAAAHPDHATLAADGEDQGTGASYGSDGSALPALGPLAGFGSWPSVASTIFTAVRDLAFFVPSSTLYFSEPWFWFPLKFRLCPFWSRDFHSDTRYVSISKVSLKPALDAVVDFLRDLSTPTFLTEVANSVKKIATLAVQNRGQTQKDNHQQLGVILVRGGRVHVACFMVSITMEYKSGKGYEQLNQTITMSRYYGLLDYQMCLDQVALIEYMDRAPVEQWGRDISSGQYQPNQSPAWSI